jgi:hypothetical protein
MQRYTDQHPDVITRQAPDQGPGRAEAQGGRRAAQGRLANATPGSAGPAPSSLAAQELNRMMATAEVQVAALKARVDEYSNSRMAPGPRVAQDGAADRSRGGPAQPRLRHDQEELRGPGVAAAVGRDVGRTRRRLGRGRLPPHRSAARDAQTGVAEPPGSCCRWRCWWLAIGAGRGIGFLGSQLRPVFSDAGTTAQQDRPADARRRQHGAWRNRTAQQERLGLLRFGSASAGLVGAVRRSA